MAQKSKKSTKKLSFRKTSPLKMLLAVIVITATAGIGTYLLTRSNAATASSSNTCQVRVSDKTLWCWGLNTFGQLGIGNNIDKNVPTQVNIAGVASVSAGSYHTCATKTDGTLWCWGDNASGQLGIGSVGSSTNKNLPTQVNIAGVASVSAGSSHTCATKTDGSLWCWGGNDNGQLGLGIGGIGSNTNKNVPTQLYIAGASSVSAGGRHTCATKTDGTLWCWGDNASGQLGIGTTIPKNVPTQLYIAGASSVSAGESYTCATKTNGTLWCWGDNSGGQLGIGSVGYTTSKNVPTQVNISGASSVATGSYHTCATKTNGTLWCWGLNHYGTLGIGTQGNTAYKTVPTQLYIAGVASVATGTSHTCATKTDGTLWCWGWNTRGQLGIGSYETKTVPTQLYFLWK